MFRFFLGDKLNLDYVIHMKYLVLSANLFIYENV